MSWHPGSRNNEAVAKHLPSGEPTLRNTIAGLETLAVVEDPIPSNQLFMGGATINSTTQSYQEQEMALHPQYYANEEPAIFEPPVANIQDYQHRMDVNRTSYASYALYNAPGQSQTHDGQLPYEYEYDRYALAQLQSSNLAHLSSTIDGYPIIPTSDFLPIQRPADNMGKLNVPIITKKKSSELVGMGLYDNVERDNSQVSNNLAMLSGEPMGRGLKLEETWQPPKGDEEEDDDDDDSSSADEAEEDVPVSFAEIEHQPAFYPTYGDMSNQSFLFDNDDQYPNCMAFDHTMQLNQPKAPDPILENSLWF